MGVRLPILLLAFLAAGCAGSDPAPALAPVTASGPQAQATGVPTAAAAPEPGDIPPDERVPAYLPAVPGLPPPYSPPIPPPLQPAPNFAPGLPPGPVTGYGAGGMQAMPGAPPNPPYPAGGLMH